MHVIYLGARVPNPGAPGGDFGHCDFCLFGVLATAKSTDLATVNRIAAVLTGVGSLLFGSRLNDG